MNAVNAFDLQVLKGLLNFRFKRSPTLNLSTLEKKKLCISYNSGGTLNINSEYISKIWPRDEELKPSISTTTLDLLCNQLYSNYRWCDLLDDLASFRPNNIPPKKPFKELNEQQKIIVNDAVRKFFHQFPDYNSFVSIVIKKQLTQEKELLHMNKEALQNDFDAKNLIKRIYVELITRKAAMLFDEENDVIEEVYNSLYKLFCTIRNELKSVPIELLMNNENYSNINIIKEILNEILRQHLTEHQSKFRKWFENATHNPRHKNISPQELQKSYPHYQNLVQSMKEMNIKLFDRAEKLHNSIK